MKQFNNIWKFIAGGGTVLGYQAFYARMTDKNSAELKESMKSVNQILDSISDKVSASKSYKEEAQNSVKEAKESLQNIVDIVEKYRNKHKEITQDYDINSKKLFKSYEEEITKAFNKSKEVTEKINDKYENIDDIKTNLTENNIFGEWIDNFNNYLYSLSTAEICLVINITSSIFILTCLVSIILATAGNFIISKFNLEKNYPKFASLIKIRVKLQNTYVITNVLFISAVIVIMIIINLITLITF